MASSRSKMTSSSTSHHSSPTCSAASDDSGLLDQTVSVLSSVAGYMRLPAVASTGVAVVLTLLLYFKQRALIYPSHIPANSRTEIPRPSQFNIKDYEELIIPTPDGEKISAFYIRGPRNRPPASNTTILMFHGNAGNIGHRLPIAQALISVLGCNVFMLEYRGYGLSTGTPDEPGLAIDAQTALDYLRDRAETRNHRIFVYGQSLGGAVAVRLTVANQHTGNISGLILENTFLSMRKLIPTVMPPAKYLTRLCHQVYPTETLLPQVTKVPILFLSGLQDEIVPPSHMRRLYELAQTHTKIWKAFPAGDHNSSVLEAGYFETIAEFICRIVRRSSTSPWTWPQSSPPPPTHRARAHDSWVDISDVTEK